MADAVASSILGVVSDRLATMALDKVRSLKGVPEELRKLESTLSAIRNVLEDAEARPVKERTLLDWLKKLKHAAYDIDDVLDEAAVEALEHKPDQSRYKEMVRKCLSFPKSLRFRHEIAKKIKEIRKRLDMISEEKSRFHLREGAADNSEVNIRPRETGSYVEKSQVYGRHEDERRIIDFLLNKFNEKNLGVISIIGLGGLGKTTLAQLVYNNGQVSQHFVTTAWVYVPEKFEIKTVVTSIIESLTLQQCEAPSMDVMEKELLEHIKGKRFLLVLDDVWNEDYEPWERLVSLLNNGAKGSKIIVTTRSRRVASLMQSDELHSLSGLSDGDCWKLFENRAFENGVNADNRNLVAIGKEIVKKCGGLPLAVKALGSALRFKREESQWRALRDNEIWTLFEDDKGILPALMLSYNHLSPRLKQCFAYCSIFPKGTKIEIQMLMQLWIAEGFVSSSDGLQYVDQLISMSLLENVMEDGHVKMHDMVHNLARFVGGGECSIVDKSSTNVPQNSRYTSLFLDQAINSPALILSSGQKLRTLHLIHERFYSQEEEVICQQVLDTIFCNMKLLRALHLSGLAIKELPATMKKLVHLRYLDLSSTMLKCLPQTIGLLHNLQTLKLQSGYLEILPKSIGNLVNLLTLDISKCWSIHSLPDTIGKLVHLQYLGLSSTNLQTLPPTIGTLHNLQRLDLSYCMELEVLPESIGGLAHLLTLNLEGCKSLHSLPNTIGELVHLQHLYLSKTKLQTLPPTIGNLKNLETLSMLYCRQLEVLPESIGGFTNLLTLYLEECRSLHSLPASIGKLIHLCHLDLSWTNLQTLPPTIGILHNLEILTMSNCRQLKVLPESIGGLTNLVTLNLHDCKSLHSLPDTIGKLVHLQFLDLSGTKLQILPVTISTLHSLETLRMSYCSQLQVLPESIGGLTNLLTLDLICCKSLHSLHDTIGKLIHLQYLDLSVTNIQTLPPTIGTLYYLHTLHFSNCKELDVLPESIGSLANLLTLNLNHCSSLHSLPETIGGLTNLLTLDLVCCKSLHSLPDTIGKLVHLRYLDLSWTNLQTLPPTIGTLHNLEILRMSNCEQLEELRESIGGLVNLLTLDLDNCKSLRSLPRTIGGLENIVTLNLNSCKSLRSLPDSIGCLCSLEVLEMPCITALETLPESMSSLSNLQRLRLDCCNRLREIPKNIQGMRSLAHLEIDGCDSLTSMPTGIGQLSQLQELKMYVLGDGENNANLAELGTLMNLKGRLRIKNLQNAKDAAEASAANLREKQSIDSLDLEWDFDADWTQVNYEGIDDFEKERKALMERVAAMDGGRVRLLEEVSRSLRPHQNLRDLRIKGYVGKTLPGWMMDIPAAPFLVELRLESFARCDNLQALEKLSCLQVLELKRFPFIECLPRLGQLPCLRVLRLYMLSGVKCLGSELYGGAGAFPALRELELQFLLGLEKWPGNANDEGDGFLSRLSELVLRDCPKLQALPSTFPSVKKLTMNADDELLLCYLKRGAFPNLNALDVGNCVDTEDESSMPEALVQRLRSVPYKWKEEKLIKWNHSKSELEKMRLETLERIATEIENKLIIKPSS